MAIDSSEQITLDPIVREVLRNGLVSTSREMGLTLLRTSYSPILNEGKDFSTAIFTRQGDMIAQMEGCPIHMASMSFAIRAIFEHFELDDIHPSDVIILNDPYRGGIQLQDVTLISPVFHEDRVLVFLAVRAHHVDIGGKVFGSFPGDATEQYQEGLVIPPMKFYERGALRRDLQEFILSNVRTRLSSLGDLEAQSAALRVGERRIKYLIDRYGSDLIEQAMEESLDYSERLIRDGIRRMPDGVYEYVDYIDDDSVTDDPIRIQVRVEVKGSDVTVDFTGSSPQVAGPLNITYPLTTTAVGIALLMVSDPGVPVNEGCFRPLTIIAPEGSVVNCRHPAATIGGSCDTTSRVVDALLGAFSAAVPERVCAGEFGSVVVTIVGGKYPDRDERFLMFLTPAGGWGGLDQGDGWDTTDEPIGNCRNQPVEYLEMRYPIIVDEYSFDGESPGPGRHRGGHGHVLRIHFLSEAALNTMSTRTKYPPYGLFGGNPGATNAHLLLDGDGVRRLRSKAVNQGLHAGAVLTILTGGGGGYGDPFDRDPALVLNDVRDGLISAATAAQCYGVILDSTQTAVDVQATRRERTREGRHKPSPDGGTRSQDWMEVKAQPLMPHVNDLMEGSNRLRRP